MMSVENKEQLIEELEEHLQQMRESCMCLKNPFIIVPHPVLFNSMGDYVHNTEYGDFYDGTTVDDYDVSYALDKMMREIIDIK